METVYFLGIDVSKKKLDSALTIDGKNYQQDEIENTAGAKNVWSEIISNDCLHGTYWRLLPSPTGFSDKK